MFKRLVEFVCTVGTPDAEEAVALALRHFDDGEAAAFIRLLTRQENCVGCKGLVERFDTLSPEVQRCLASTGDRLSGTLRQVVMQGSAAACLNALSVVRLAGNPRLGYLAADALTKGSAEVRQRAAETLRHLTDRYFAREAEVRAGLAETYEPGVAAARAQAGVMQQLATERSGLVEALRQGLGTFTSHHQLAVLESAMYFIDDLTSELLAPVGGQRFRLSHAMLEVFARSSDGRLAAFAYAAVTHPELRVAVLNTLMTRRDGEFFAGMIAQRWRTRVAPVRQAVTGIHRLAWLDHGIGPLMALPRELHADGVSWLASLGLPDERLHDLLHAAVEYEEPQTQARVAKLLAERRSPLALATLKHLADSDHAEAARLARAELARREAEAEKGGDGEAQPVYGGWDELLRRCRLAPTLESLWEAADWLPVAPADFGGETALQRVPRLGSLVRERLYSDEPAARVRAMRLVAALGLDGTFRDDLYVLADHPDATVRALAAAALGRIGDATSRRILHRLVTDEDATVRLRAVEALEAVATDQYVELLEARMEDESPAVRVVAVRALLRRRVPQGVVGLTEMLNDGDAEHRHAGLSLVSDMRLTALRPYVARLAVSDRSESVRRRAQRVLRTLDDSGARKGRPATAAAAESLKE